MIGSEQSLAPELNPLERLYLRVFGFPALGLRVRAQTVLPLLYSLPDPATILDAGCGKGVFSLSLAQVFPDACVVGMDASPTVVERNTQLAGRMRLRNVRFVAADLTQLDAQGTYDAILATDVLEHVSDDHDLLRRLLAALRPGGRLVLHVPHVTRHIWGWTRLNFMGIEGHVRPGYALADLWNMLDRTGFRIESANYDYNSIETLLNDVSYLITGGRERRKWLYALCFPFLLTASWLSHGMREAPGSGLVFVACRPHVAARGGDVTCDPSNAAAA